MNAPLIVQFVLITGSPVTGFALTGPFNTREDAAAHMRKFFTASTCPPYWIAPLFNPGKE